MGTNLKGRGVISGALLKTPANRPAFTHIAGWLALLAAFVLALILRADQARSSLVFDEYASLFFSARSWHELWGWWMLRETNPPLFYSVLKIWRSILPENQVFLRALPTVLSLAHMAIVAHIAQRAYGGYAAALSVLLMAVAPSDIYQSEYIRAYVLAQLAVTISFAGLLHAMNDDAPGRGWIVYVVGAVVANYSHTTMLLWPFIASLAVLLVYGRHITRRQVKMLLVSGAAILALSAWVIIVAMMQLGADAGDIAWIQPLSLDDFASSVDLQLLQDAPFTSAIMGGLMITGAVRTWRNPVTRLCLVIVPAALIAFKAADTVHPIISDYTLRWCASFTVLLGAAALARWRRAPKREATVAALTFVLVGAAVWYALDTEVWIPQPQDFRTLLATVASRPGAALLASHEADGVVIQQACMLEFRQPSCPFPFLVLANSARSDHWARGGFAGKLWAPDQARAALAGVRVVYAFSRYVYTPLTQLGLDERRYRRLEWDDGELIGPIPAADFARARRSAR